MCFHIQSGLWLEDFGVAISGSFVVGKAGDEQLCDGTRGLIVVD